MGPIIRAGQSFSGKVGVWFTATTPALDDSSPDRFDRPVTSWTATGLPAGLAQNPSTGAITGTPTAKGSFTASFTATNSLGTSAATSIAFTITDGVPIIRAGQSASGVVGSAFSKIFSLTDSTNRPVTSWAATSHVIGGDMVFQGLPSWATLNPTTGAITGTPQNRGSITLTLTATGPGGTDTEEVTISIAVGPPIIVAGQSFSGKVGVAFTPSSLSLTDSANRPVTSWAATGLPVGLSLDASTGAITGTPTTKGSFTASFTAIGEGGTSTVSVAFTIAVGVPIIVAGQAVSGVVGTAFSKIFSLTDSTNRPVTSWAATGLPSWATLNPITGAITGTPQNSGNATITLTATGPGGTSAATTATISISTMVGVVRLTRKVVVGGMSVEPYNEVTLRGAKYTNARWTREGAIPLGLNWGSSPDGLRFWGTPQETGEMSAIFEGPYPDGFQSNLTDAGQQSGGVVGCAQLSGGLGSASFLVDRYEVKFVVQEVPLVTDGNGGVGVSNYTFGEVLAELLGNPSVSQAAWRGSWGVSAGQRKLTTRGGTASIASSSVAPTFAGVGGKMPFFYRGAGSPTVPVVQAGDLVPEDMAASDWRFGGGVVVARGGQGVLRTAGAQVQSLAGETTSSYADYVGETLDGVRRSCVFQAEIPLLPGVCWGEFYLRAGFSGRVQVLFYTTDRGAVTDRLAAQLGLKFFYHVQESAAAAYRSARTGMAYDFLSGSEQICRAALPMEGRHGVYRLHVPSDIPPGTMANLSIFVKGDV